jgi:hypothetical protein
MRSNYAGPGEQLGDEIEESSPTDVRLLFTDDTEPTGDACMVYIAPAVTSEGIVFSKAALTTLEENVQTKDPYVVDVKSDIAEVQ